ncbi:unnamed protein product [Anisakis simplex]|uniref:Fatty-acid and retinol-binding protein 1 n=1 Tax=Anisakis simplex TaxID=6269 RepID=A0A0M3J1J9_ANISI|nr:unnamed protein product [Anisakis simplex]
MMLRLNKLILLTIVFALSEQAAVPKPHAKEGQKLEAGIGLTPKQLARIEKDEAEVKKSVLKFLPEVPKELALEMYQILSDADSSVSDMEAVLSKLAPIILKSKDKPKVEYVLNMVKIMIENRIKLVSDILLT